MRMNYSTNVIYMQRTRNTHRGGQRMIRLRDEEEKSIDDCVAYKHWQSSTS
jgi:hypothetical protein